MIKRITILPVLLFCATVVFAQTTDPKPDKPEKKEIEKEQEHTDQKTKKVRSDKPSGEKQSMQKRTKYRKAPAYKNADQKTESRVKKHNHTLQRMIDVREKDSTAKDKKEKKEVQSAKKTLKLEKASPNQKKSEQ